MDFNISLRQSKSTVSAALATVDADGTLTAILPAYEKLGVQLDL